MKRSSSGKLHTMVGLLVKGNRSHIFSVDCKTNREDAHSCTQRTRPHGESMSSSNKTNVIPVSYARVKSNVISLVVFPWSGHYFAHALNMVGCICSKSRIRGQEPTFQRGQSSYNAISTL